MILGYVREWKGVRGSIRDRHKPRRGDRANDEAPQELSATRTVGVQTAKARHQLVRIANPDNINDNNNNNNNKNNNDNNKNDNSTKAGRT